MLSKNLARQLLDAAADPSLVVDEEGGICYVSSRIEDVLGYAPSELVGRPLEVLLPERLRGAHLQHRGRYFASPRPRPMGLDLALYALHKDGREIPVEISLNPVGTVDGMLVSAALRDVSRQKDLERQLQEANRAKSRFLAAASHDLRQPLQTLALLNAAARKTATSSVHSDIIEKQQRSLDSMARLLNSLLDIGKLESGIVKPDLTDVTIQEIFDSLREEFETQAVSKGLELVVEPCHGFARSDPRLLKQILSNLLSNAIRYTREGLVSLRCVHRAARVRLEVMDTGIGIAPDALDEIFEEFHQLDTGERRPEGFGLGLAIVRRTAALLDCAVRVESRPGEGSVFSVSVPVPTGRRRARAASAALPAAPPAARAGLILVVDDEPAVADATSLLLTVEGFDVLTAASEREALERVQDRMPLLVISDYHLRSRSSGLDVIQSVRKQIGADLPGILLSGDTSHGIALDGVEHVRFLTKPVDTTELLAEIDRVIIATRGPTAER